MSIQNEIERLQFDIADSYSAVYEKSGELPESDERNADNLPSAIRSITAASELNFTGGLNRDGLDVTVVTPVRASLTREEYNALPENEKNQGMYVVTSEADLSVEQIELPFSAKWEIFTYGGGNYVMSSDLDYKMAHSVDGVTWESVQQPFYAGAGIMLYGADKFVIVRSGNVWTSEDGVSWTSRSPLLNPSNYCGLYDGDKFVVIGSGKYTFTSLDGISWTKHTISIDASMWYSIGYNNGIFLSTVKSGSTIYTSHDGANWSSITSFLQGSKYRVVSGNGFFLLYLNGHIVKTTDVVSKEEKQIFPLNTDKFYSIVFCNGVFVGLVNYNYGPYTLYISKDGLDWSPTSVTLPHGIGEYILGTDDSKVYVIQPNTTNEYILSYISPSVESIIIDGNETKIPSDIHIFSDGLTDAKGDISVTTPVRGVFTQEAFDALPEEEQNKGFYIVNDEEAAE